MKDNFKTQPTYMKKLVGIIPTILGSSILLMANIPYSLAGTAPSCVSTKLYDAGFTDRLEVKNNCKNGVRVKVVLAFATDKACTYISPGRYGVFTWDYPGRFDRLESC